MDINFFNQVETHLNPERLDAYRQDGADEVTTLARYLLNMALCESLYSPLQVAEITLRNALHESLSTRAGTDTWYDTLPLTEVRSEGLTPWREKLSNNWPITPAP